MTVHVGDPVLYQQRPGAVRMGQVDLAGLVLHLNGDGTADLVTFSIDGEPQFQRRVPQAESPEKLAGHTFYRHNAEIDELRAEINDLRAATQATIAELKAKLETERQARRGQDDAAV